MRAGGAGVKVSVVQKPYNLKPCRSPACAARPTRLAGPDCRCGRRSHAPLPGVVCSELSPSATADPAAGSRGTTRARASTRCKSWRTPACPLSSLSCEWGTWCPLLQILRISIAISLKWVGRFLCSPASGDLYCDLTEVGCHGSLTQHWMRKLEFLPEISTRCRSWRTPACRPSSLFCEFLMPFVHFL